MHLKINSIQCLRIGGKKNRCKIHLNLKRKNIHWNFNRKVDKKSMMLNNSVACLLCVTYDDIKCHFCVDVSIVRSSFLSIQRLECDVTFKNHRQFGSTVVN